MFCLTKLAQLVGRFQHLEYRNMPFLNPCWWLDCLGESIWWVYCSLCGPQKRHLPLSSVFVCHNVAWIYWQQHRQISELQSWLSISEFNKKHMFFKKVHGLSELRFKNSTIFLHVKTEKKTVFMFALQCFFFTHRFEFIQWVILPYTTYSFIVFFCGIWISQYAKIPSTQPGFNKQSAGGPGQHSARTQFKKTVTERVWNSIFSGEAVTEDVQHWMGWLEDFP